MEQETILKEILYTLKEHSKQMNAKVDNLERKMNKRFAKVDERFDEVDKRFAKVDERFDEVDKRFEEMDKRFDKIDCKIDNLNTKYAGLRTDLHETQETAEFATNKVIQHEKKLRKIIMQ